MRGVLLGVAAAIVIGLRLWLRRRRAHRSSAPAARGASLGPDLTGAGLVAAREVRERVRGRTFRIGTVFILLAVAAAIVIPVLHNGSSRPQQVGIVGALDAHSRTVVLDTASTLGIGVHLVAEPSLTAARTALDNGHLDLALVDASLVVVKTAPSASDTSATAQLTSALASVLGVQEAYREAGLTPAQIDRLSHAPPLRVASLSPSTTSHAQGSSIIGVILVFVMLNQYNTWILLGVMEEKASRVVEVLLATLRPAQLLAGKVLGIGLVALGQATLIVAFALGLAKVLGSNLLEGTAPLEIAAALLWLVLGYAFYCWVYAAAASMAERQDQVQSLAFPLSIPILVGYISALTVASTGNVTLWIRVLAYLPPTAPFAMPVLVGIGQATWWQFWGSVAITIACTVGVARYASIIYRRAILRTGARVRWRDVLRAA